MEIVPDKGKSKDFGASFYSLSLALMSALQLDLMDARILVLLNRNVSSKQSVEKNIEGDIWAFVWQGRAVSIEEKIINALYPDQKEFHYLANELNKLGFQYQQAKGMVERHCREIERELTMEKIATRLDNLEKAKMITTQVERAGIVRIKLNLRYIRLGYQQLDHWK